MAKRAPNQTWTREQLEEILEAKGSVQHREIADRYGLKPGSIYSVRCRIRNIGIDGILEAQSNRYSTYGGSTLRSTSREQIRKRSLQTPEQELAKSYMIQLAVAGRGDRIQYSVTIPTNLGSSFVKQYGRKVRFIPTWDGFKVVPAAEE